MSKFDTVTNFDRWRAQLALRLLRKMAMLIVRLSALRAQRERMNLLICALDDAIQYV